MSADPPALKDIAKCQCGRLSLESPADPDVVAACNCKACQKRTGAAFGVGAHFKIADLKISGPSHTWSLEMRSEHMGVALGCLEAPVAEPARAIWTSEKHDWVRFPDHWPTFDGGTPEI